MAVQKIIENTFFFAILGGASFLMWKLFAPFGGALALAAIVVTICYPLHELIRVRWCRGNTTWSAFLSVFVVLLAVVFPFAILGSLLLREAVSVYSLFSASPHASFAESFVHVEVLIQKFVPEFSLDISSFVTQIATFVSSHLLGLFTGTASTIFYLFITLIASFYFFRDGKVFTEYLIRLSPLKDMEDGLILRRVAQAVRSVALGTVLVALIQGILTSIGLALFGFDRAILLGSIAAIGALIPGVGTAIVFIPTIAFLIFAGEHLLAGGLAVWAVVAVGLIDNVLGPYFMSRGNPLHPFIILLSVLGGIAFFGPIGFVLGPVIATLFTVLLEMYVLYIHE